MKITDLRSAAYGRTSIYYVLYDFKNKKQIKGYSSSTSARRKVNIGDVFICSYDNKEPRIQYVYWDKRIKDLNIYITDKVPEHHIQDKLTFMQILNCSIQ